MANKKINDIAAAGSVTDAMQFETDIGGSTENKVTAAQIKDYAVRDEQQVYSVGKEGSNTNSGLNINNKMDEPATAIAAISSTLSSGNPVAINCRDGGVYDSWAVNGKEFVNLHFPDAVTSGVAQIGEDNHVTFKEFRKTDAGGGAVVKWLDGESYLKADTITAPPAVLNTNIENRGGTLYSSVGVLNVGDSSQFSINQLSGASALYNNYHRGFTVNGKLYVETIGTMNLSVNEFTNDVTMNPASRFELVTARHLGSITTSSSDTITLVCGERVGTGSDVIDATSNVRQLVARGDRSIVDGMQALTYHTTLKTASFILNWNDGGTETFVSRTTAGNITFSDNLTSGNIPVGGQGEILNVGNGRWNLLTAATAVLESNYPIMPLMKGEYIRWLKRSATTFYLFRSEPTYTYLLNGNLTGTSLTAYRRIVMNTLSANATIQISTLDVQSGTPNNPRVIEIQDRTGNCGTYTITISLQSGTINGAATFVLSAPYAKVSIEMDGTNGFAS
jgi:hypothetical protein